MSYAARARRNEPASAETTKARPGNGFGRLRIGSPGDAFEQEADRVAEAAVAGDTIRASWSLSLMRVDPQLQRKCDCGSPEHSSPCSECRDQKATSELSLISGEGRDGILQRQVEPTEEESDDSEFDAKDEMEEDDEIEPYEGETTEPLIQGKVLPGFGLDHSASLEQRIARLRSGGTPLPDTTRNFFERRLGYDFSRVRIHADTPAAEAAKAAQARAFTMGSDIVFGAGQRAFDTSVGQRLLAHELTHVIQQGAAHRAKAPDHPIDAIGVGRPEVRLRSRRDVLQASPETCTFGEIEQWAVVSLSDLAAPDGLADAKASIGAACARNTARSNCHCVDGAGRTSPPGTVAAWKNIVTANGGTDVSGGGNFICVGHQHCKIVHKCRAASGRWVNRQTNLVPSGTATVKDHGTIYFYSDPRLGRCPPVPKTKPKKSPPKPKIFLSEREGAGD
jgi:hypothetical protein